MYTNLLRERRISIMLSCLIIGVTILFYSCSSNKESVTLVVRTGLESDGLRVIAKVFTKNTGIIVNIRELGRENYYSSVPTQLITGSAKFDIAFLPSTIIPEIASTGALVSLDNLINTKDKDLISVYGYKNVTYALPCDISSMFMYYRNDLIDDPPSTWDEYLEVSRKYSARINPKSPTKYGCAIPGMTAEDLPKAWYCILWSNGGYIIDQKNTIGIGQENSIKAADFYKRLVEEKVMAEDITSWGYSQVYENLENGNLCIAAPFWNAAATVLLTSDSKYKDKISYTVLPGIRQQDGSIKRCSFQHAWTLAINSKSKNIKSAAKFIEFATSYEGGKLYAESAKGNPARISILSDSSLQVTRPDFKILLESLKISKAEPEIVNYAQLHNIMTEALTQIMNLSKTPREEMVNAGSRIKSILK